LRKDISTITGEYDRGHLATHSRVDEAPPLNAVDKDELFKSWKEVRHVEASGATIICGHDESQWSGLRKGIDGYE
jgi:hypothetical protein